MKPKNADHSFPGLIIGNKNGNTPEAKNICPRLANIPETDFICSEDNSSSINYNNSKSKNDVNIKKIKNINMDAEFAPKSPLRTTHQPV